MRGLIKRPTSPWYHEISGDYSFRYIKTPPGWRAVVAVRSDLHAHKHAGEILSFPEPSSRTFSTLADARMALHKWEHALHE